MTSGRLDRRSIPPVYALADVETVGAEGFPDAVAEMAGNGIRWIQIRAKTLPDADLFTLVEACFERLAGELAEGLALWMNDRADVAALFPFAGLHLGQRDLPPTAARRVVGPEVWIGASAHNEEELARAVADPEVDVVAVGPVFPTTGKQDPDPPVGMGFVSRARASTAKPLVAIGGVAAETLGQVLRAGADSVATLGAVCRGDIVANARRLMLSAEVAR